MTQRRHFPTVSYLAPLLFALLPAVCPAAPCPAPSISLGNQTVETDCSAAPAPHVPQTTEFVGSFAGRNAARTLGGQSTYEGHVIFLEKPRALVEDLLPQNSGLHLAAPSSTATDPSNYPVLVMYGLQANLTWSLPPPYVPLPQAQYPDYDELVLLIPFVQKDGGSSNWHNYIVRMYLKWQLGVDVGIAYYGYEKRLGSFGTEALPPLTSASSTPPAVQMSVCSPTSATPGCSASSSGKQFTARMSGVGAWRPSNAFDSLDSYQAMKSILSMPVLGTCEAPNFFGSCYMFGASAVLPIVVTNGGYMCSYFVFTWDSAQARTESAELAFLSDFSLQGGNLGPWTQQVMRNVPDGAFGVKDLNWQLTLSQACVW